MNSPKKPKSLQEILKQRQQITFVGREPQLALFRQNLGRSRLSRNIEGRQ